jgi:hypothetical protein
VKLKDLLNEDEFELYDDLIRHPGWRPLMKVVSLLRSDFDNSVLTYNLEEGPERLVYAKARSEGAKMLEQKIRDLTKQLSSKPKA